MTYKAHTSMLIQETAKMNPFLQDLAVSAMLKDRIEGLRTLLHSRHILSEVATELELINENSSDADRDYVIASLSSRLTMTMLGKDLIQISFSSDTPTGMKEFLTSVSTHFMEQLLAPERSSMKDSSSFLLENLKERQIELDHAELKLAEFKAKYADALPELHTMNIARLSQLNQKLAEREAELAGRTKSLGGLNNLLSRTNPVVGKIEEQIVRIRSELALLSSRYTEKHSKIQARKRTLKRLEAERNRTLENTENLVNADQLWDIASIKIPNDDGTQPLLVSQLKNLQIAKSEVDSLNEETSRLRDMIAKIENSVKNFGDKESQLTRLQRDLNVKRELYEDLLHRYEMAKVTGSLGQFEESKRVKIIDRPFTPSKPVNLPLPVFFIMGLVGGIFLGIGLAVVLEMIDTTIRSRHKFEEIYGIPVASRIPPLTL